MFFQSPDFEALVINFPQPWAWAVTWLGKDAEYQPSYPPKLGWAAIRAGSTCEEVGRDWIEKQFEIAVPQCEEFTYNSIVGFVYISEVKSYLEKDDSTWGMPYFNRWEFREIKRLKNPIKFSTETDLIVAPFAKDLFEEGAMEEVKLSHTNQQVTENFSFWTTRQNSQP